MSRGARIATQLRKEYNLHGKINYSLLEDLCFAHDSYVKYDNVDGAQGRIIFSKNSDSSIITINEEIDYLPKKKFVLGHELGHRLLHFKIMNFICDDDDFHKWTNNDRYEYEANDFSAEILMPEFLVRSITSGKTLNSNLLQTLSDELGTSLTSACIQYSKYGEIPCYVILSKNGSVEWVARNTDLNLGYIERGQELPKGSSPRIFFDKGKKSTIDVCLASDWFPNHSKQDLYLYEDSFYLESYSSVITLLWICEDYN
jgi:Zn-dependent peptidase ImmA (M78 family)